MLGECVCYFSTKNPRGINHVFKTQSRALFLTQFNPCLSHHFLRVVLRYQIPGFCTGGTTIPGIQNQVNCDIIVGYKSVYRMCFAMACFFFLFSLIMIRVRSSKDPRAPIQNGFVLQLQHLSSEQ